MRVRVLARITLIEPVLAVRPEKTAACLFLVRPDMLFDLTIVN